jgi:hypothetical protein
MTAAIEAGGNGLVGGIDEGDQWGGRSIHADGGGGEIWQMKLVVSGGEYLLAVFVSGINQFLIVS